MDEEKCQFRGLKPGARKRRFGRHNFAQRYDFRTDPTDRPPQRDAVLAETFSLRPMQELGPRMIKFRHLRVADLRFVLIILLFLPCIMSMTDDEAILEALGRPSSSSPERSNMIQTQGSEKPYLAGFTINSDGTKSQILVPVEAPEVKIEWRKRMKVGEAFIARGEWIEVSCAGGGGGLEALDLNFNTTVIFPHVIRHLKCSRASWTLASFTPRFPPPPSTIFTSPSRTPPWPFLSPVSPGWTSLTRR